MTLNLPSSSSLQSHPSVLRNRIRVLVHDLSCSARASLAICRGRGKACRRLHLREFRSLGRFRGVSRGGLRQLRPDRATAVPLRDFRPLRPAGYWEQRPPLGARRARVDRRRELDEVLARACACRASSSSSFGIMTASVYRSCGTGERTRSPPSSERYWVLRFSWQRDRESRPTAKPTPRSVPHCGIDMAAYWIRIGPPRIASLSGRYRVRLSSEL
jgi:hypothetical protein